MNQGLTGEEIAAKIALPPALLGQWYNRPYYGSLSFNARAVYQYYMGWYDANPVHLAPLPFEDGGRRYVEALGGPARVRELAGAAYEKGDYGWAAELLNRLVFADGQDEAAKDLLAEGYQQLAWQSENSLARNMYLTGALELRKGPSVPSRRWRFPWRAAELGRVRYAGDARGARESGGRPVAHPLYLHRPREGSRGRADRQWRHDAQPCRDLRSGGYDGDRQSARNPGPRDGHGGRKSG